MQRNECHGGAATRWRRSLAAGASALALGAGGAWALPPARVVTTAVADYNAAQVANADGVLTVPAGLATYGLNQGTLEINSRFTVTLPANFAFASQPALSDTGAAGFALVAGGIGAQSATFEIQAAAVLPGQSITLGSFAIQGAAALATPVPVAAALPISLQATNNAQIANNDPAPLVAGAFASEPGATLQFIGISQYIDMAPPELGTAYADNGTSGVACCAWHPQPGINSAAGAAERSPLVVEPPDVTTVPIGTLTMTAQQHDAATGRVPVLSPNGAPNQLSSADTATVTVHGFFNGIVAAYISSTGDCQTPIITGTVAAQTLTLPDVPLDPVHSPTLAICMTANATDLLQQNLDGFPVQFAPPPGSDFLAADATPLFAGFIGYSGGSVLTVTNFLTGDDAGYASLLRVNNAGDGPVTLYAVVQPDGGGAPLAGSLGTLAGGAGTVFSESQLEAAVPGLSLANSGQRATLQLVIAGNFPNVAASSLLVNPSGVVDNVGVPLQQAQPTF